MNSSLYFLIDSWVMTANKELETRFPKLILEGISYLL
jgi:hypothetical protein